MANMKVVITKRMTFKGEAEEFSNGYTLQTATATAQDPAIVEAVADALVIMEKTFHSSIVDFVKAYGGPVGMEAVYVEDFSPVQQGSGALSSMHPESCIFAQARVARGRYLSKWYHTQMHVGSTAEGQHDVVPTAAVTAINTALLKLTDGTLPSGLKCCAPNGDLPVGNFTVDAYIRTHQLEARGKRPAPASG